jgi:hypothetical protein
VSLPRGTFVFVLSDFLALPDEAIWVEALERGWDPVPVVVQDRVWEQSFPDVGGVAVPVLVPESGAREVLRLTSREATRRREANELRFGRLLDAFADVGVDPVVLTSSDVGDVLAAFLEWAGERAARIAELRRGIA